MNSEPNRIQPLTDEQIDRWIAALESGDYVHGKGCLKKVDQNGWMVHCCLGVLIETLKDDGFGINPKKVESIDQNGYQNPVVDSQYEFNIVTVDGKEDGYRPFGYLIGHTYEPLYAINDAEETHDYTKQVQWIKDYVKTRKSFQPFGVVQGQISFVN